MRDYYEILKVHPQASFETIAKGYRSQIKKNHPDINRAVDAREKTILINQAYEVLSDPVKRGQYDDEYFDDFEPAKVKSSKRKTGFRPFLWWLVMLLFILADTLYQLSTADPAPVSQTIFILFLLFTAMRDSGRSFILRVGWMLGVYVLWVALQGLATFVVWKLSMKLPIALVIIALSQCPAFLFAMRRSVYFTKTVS